MAGAKSLNRGEIYWVELPIPKGSEPGYRRPMLIVQAGYLNKSKLPTVMVCPLTGNLRLAQSPGNVLVKARESGLARDSVVMVHSIITINKSDLESKAGAIPDHLMLAVEEGMSASLELI